MPSAVPFVDFATRSGATIDRARLAPFIRSLRHPVFTGSITSTYNYKRNYLQKRARSDTAPTAYAAHRDRCATSDAGEFARAIRAFRVHAPACSSSPAIDRPE